MCWSVISTMCISIISGCNTFIMLRFLQHLKMSAWLAAPGEDKVSPQAAMQRGGGGRSGGRSLKKNVVQYLKKGCVFKPPDARRTLR